ncbi:MurR/RpiR family transcriptional regulator [Spiroplasma platyhelix]|uniref:MurR/RpiR family transcriptional regulator n=1 Tax=Spiroplasma platyhelix PALS-1 TaxID=1276218 RepID=A0A846U0V4_9MOLU|nr:MurR/RpiR family transcriptional regulator [Spiroplasma platyhelix]MBE4703776.1 putative HTH-type transcriptional regulator YbbH [Spiroplasma platyhelix PALS-1]NKE38149.1 MurR/RpiR family transcriptional regulator [Spiroplasma platyhelix PALS-1]UJB29034.1 hypothetical protein SPLAT_v1c02700 [Spiroplasma platyhelix PALS-1]
MEIDIIREIKKISLNNKHRFYFIAKYIIDHITEIPKITITDLAKVTFSSPSTINRFTKSLDLSGYKELVHIIKYFNYTLVDSDKLAKQDSESNILYQRYHDVLNSIQDTFNLFVAQEDLATQVVSKLRNAKRINIFAVGGTYNLARDFQEKLLRMGFNAVSSNNFHDGYFLVKQTNKDTVNMFISYSGETKDLIKLASICKENNSQVVTISKKSNNTLGRLADFKLEISSNDPIVRIVSLTNRLALIFCLDMILYKLLFTDFEHYKDLLQKTALNKF